MPEATLAREIMTTEVTVFQKDMELLAAARILFDNRWAGAPVLDGDRLVGVVTLADVIQVRRSVHSPSPIVLFDALLFLGSRRFERELKKVTAMTVGDAMSSPARTVGPETAIAEVAAQMADQNLTTLPVVDKGKVVGIIGRRDVVRLILDKQPRVPAP